MTLRSILAVTDFSSKGCHAIARAALLCAEHRATLKLVYLAHPDEAPPPDAAVRLAQHALQLKQRHHITVQAATRMDLTAADVAREAADAVTSASVRLSSSASSPPNGPLPSCASAASSAARSRIFSPRPPAWRNIARP